MQKHLFSITSFIISLVFSLSLSAQQNVIISDEVLEFRSQKMEILSSTLLTETILDSIIRYKFTSETHSVRILKNIYEVDDDGKTETRMECSWHNNQWVDSSKTNLTFNDMDTYHIIYTKGP